MNCKGCGWKTLWLNSRYYSSILVKGLTKTTRNFRIKTTVFWDVAPHSLVEEYDLLGLMPCSSVGVFRYFRGTYHLHLQDQAKQETDSK
jgi:hypothetical protein